jgi:ubiquinone biosynthesis protein Coq4
MRALIMEKMYDWSKRPYQKFFKKNTPWNCSTAELLNYPQETLGHQLGYFLKINHFEIQPKLEDHDVFHVLTQTGITVPEEIGMQFYLCGNGKKSLYQYVVILLGAFFYMDQWSYFHAQYQRGKSAYTFHYLDFSKMLSIPTITLQQTFNII